MSAETAAWIAIVPLGAVCAWIFAPVLWKMGGRWVFRAFARHLDAKNHPPWRL
jgi:hypothetical protein